jgi:hypothetical protein
MMNITEYSLQQRAGCSVIDVRHGGGGVEVGRGHSLLSEKVWRGRVEARADCREAPFAFEVDHMTEGCKDQGDRWPRIIG